MPTKSPSFPGPLQTGEGPEPPQYPLLDPQILKEISPEYLLEGLMLELLGHSNTPNSSALATW